MMGKNVKETRKKLICGNCIRVEINVFFHACNGKNPNFFTTDVKEDISFDSGSHVYLESRLSVQETIYQASSADHYFSLFFTISANNMLDFGEIMKSRDLQGRVVALPCKKKLSSSLSSSRLSNISRNPSAEVRCISNKITYFKEL
ncbi:hypothetical protein PV327_008777 [Microctonus hyperodae]|uniref:Uncharacterized protein n=1 Tax=Microctonus hyperodae TaxID=165561 RepID=A0AA39FT20_MICHY|nr:hypothetical protein PV327_008777 [Microctonus hyperodae]